LAANKHLVLDASVILDLWLRPERAMATEALFASAEQGRTSLWVSAASLPTLEFVAVRRCKEQGIDPTVARSLVKRLMLDLLNRVRVLSNRGYEQAELYAKSTDFEDAQLAASARSISAGQVCIVSSDAAFDALGEFSFQSRPEQALEWLRQENTSEQETLSFIDLAAQQVALRPQIERNIDIVLHHGQYIMGPEVKALEEKLAEYSGAKHCITVASGTEALLISLMALGVGAGDEVITTPFTFVATAEVIVLLGAKPVFVDIEPDTCNIDASRIEAAITPKTKAIMPVSLYGQPADMDEINAIAAKYKLPVIEDAAQSFGAEYKGRKSCNLSTIGCTSFFPSKPLGCYGDGGAIFTSDDASRRRAGKSASMVKASAIGIRVSALVAAWTPCNVPSCWPSWSVSMRKLSSVSQSEAKLSEAGVPTAVHYPLPLNEQPAYKRQSCPDCTPLIERSCEVGVEFADGG
jgi:UDP-2-acetamido-2-deoxy-ribo-hexuluronate aminotransferase